MTRGTSQRGRGRLALAIVLGLGACGPSAAINRSSVASEIGDGVDAGTTGGSGGGSGGDSGGGSGGSNNTGGSGSGGTTETGGSGGATETGGSGGTSPGTGGSPATGGSGGSTDAGVDTSPGVADTAADTIKNNGPVVTVSFTLAGATSNLTTVGKLDWMHWGYQTATAVNKKKNSPGLITMKKIGSPDMGHYDSRPATLSWSDGNPKTSVVEISDGVEMEDKTGIGFEVSVKGNKSKPRTLTLYLGGWQAKAKFTAQLASAPDAGYSNDMFRATDPGVDRIYTVVFQPNTDNDVLTVRWTTEEILDTFGNVTLQAAALSE